VSATDELLKNNEAFAEGFDKGDLPLAPAKKVAVVACMDARVNPYPILGLELGDAHVIRSVVISQRALGTEEIILIHHTGCGMLTFSDDEFKRQIQDDTGIKPSWSAEAFSDLDEDVRQSIERIKSSPFIPNKGSVRGFVYEVETGRLREVT
jgi:carbonic anhydrase